jgi:hypothetical protein
MGHGRPAGLCLYLASTSEHILVFGADRSMCVYRKCSGISGGSQKVWQAYRADLVLVGHYIVAILHLPTPVPVTHRCSPHSTCKLRERRGSATSPTTSSGLLPKLPGLPLVAGRRRATYSRSVEQEQLASGAVIVPWMKKRFAEHQVLMRAPYQLPSPSVCSRRVCQQQRPRNGRPGPRA